jgi:hypothetical protein
MVSMKRYFLHLGFSLFLIVGALHSEELVCPKTAEENKALIEKLAKLNGNNLCTEARNTYRTLYLCLQQQLDYDGKKTILKNGKAVSSEDKAPEGASNGKKFQDALYKEFKNSLIKVAALYQTAKKDSPEPVSEKDSKGKEIIGLLKIIDPEIVNYKDDAHINFNKFFENLLSKSKEKFKDNEKLQLNSDDILLLQKLLIHAQDRVCLLQRLETKGKATKSFSKEYLKEVAQSPLNQLLLALKQSDSPDKVLLKPEEFTKDELAIQESVKSAFKSLKDFYNDKNYKQCLQDKNKQLAIMNSIQDNIQVCNYKKFLDALNGPDTNNLEAILHFINANEQLMKDEKPLNPKATIAADAGLKNLNVAEIVQSIAKPEASKISCTGDASPYTISNLKKNSDGSVNKDQFKCITSVDDKEKSGDDCFKLIKIAGDKISKNPDVSGQPTLSSLSIQGSDDKKCNDMFKVEPPAPAIDPEQTKCEARNPNEEEPQYIKFGAKKQFTWDAKTQICNDSKATPESKATPDSGPEAEQAPKEPVQIQPPTLQPRFNIPSRGGVMMMPGVF